MRAVLDVNVLIAALAAGHVQPGYPSPVRPTDVIERLREATDHSAHAFWADDISLLDSNAIRADRVLGPRQVTDVYLLALAVRHGGRLVTLDCRIPIESVPGARREHLLAL